MRLRMLRRAAALAMASALIASVGVFAAELVTAELDGTENDVTVTQGQSANFTISLSATGSLACGRVSTATVDTVYAISLGGAITGTTPSSPVTFTGSGDPVGGPNCDVEGSGTASATVSANAGTPVDTYTIVLWPNTGTTSIANHSESGGKLADTTGTTLTFRVVAPSSTNGASRCRCGRLLSGNEGASIAVDGSGSTDPDGDSLTYAWSATGGTGTCLFADASLAETTVTCDDNGTYTLSLEVSDGALSDSDTASLVVGNVAPVITSASFGDPVSCGANNATLTVSFTDAGTADTHTSLIDWGDSEDDTTVDPAASGFTESHTYGAGSHTASVTVTDDDGDSDSENASVVVLYNDSGIRQPINTDGTSTFKLGSTIPVKIQFTDCDGNAVDSLAPVIDLVKTDPTPDGTVNEAPPAASADFGNVMRWSADGQQYIFNLSTKRSQFSPTSDLVAGTYRLRISVGGIQYEEVFFSLRK